MVSPLESELKEILDQPRESRSVEFKAGLKWGSTAKETRNDQYCVKAIKTILAMSNSEFGGWFVIGVTELPEGGKWEVTGVTEELSDSFDQDKMYDQIQNYGDPSPQFDVIKITYKKMMIVGIHVYPSSDSPIISVDTNNVPDFDRSVLYYRTHKASTTVARTSQELRPILKFSEAHRMSGLANQLSKLFVCLSAPSSGSSEDEDKYNDDLGYLRPIK